MKYLLIVISLYISTNSYSQKTKGDYNLIVSKTTGDLNKDKLDDLVVVSQDSLNENRPYRVQIFFAKPNGGYKLIASADSAIQAQYPYGNGNSGDVFFVNIKIEKGILLIYNDLIRGHYEHKFRYQNSNMELIGFSITNSDGHGIIDRRDFNLSTGVMIETVEHYDGDGKTTSKKKVVKIKPLPIIQNFAPYTQKTKYLF